METPNKHLRWCASALGLGLGAYATYVGVTWLRYGHQAARTVRPNTLMDTFMPEHDVAEHHRIYVPAPADLTFRTACETDLLGSRVVRAIFAAREVLLRSVHKSQHRPFTLIRSMQSIGWTVLAEAPGHEIVMGSVTQPWRADVVFESVPPDEFLNFSKPEYVKIAWVIVADPVGATESVLRTETRAVATDEIARARFRPYWALLSPGIMLIRKLLLRQVRAEAEAKTRQTRRSVDPVAC